MWFSGNRFPTPWTANMYFIPGSIVISQSKDLSARAFWSPANQLQVVLLVHALVDRSQSISTHNSVLARLERLFPLPPCTFTSHFQGLPFLGVAQVPTFYLLVSLHHIDMYFLYKKNYLVISLKLLLINGFGDKCCWRQPFSPTLKRCLGCPSLGEKHGHIHFPSLPSPQELGIGTRHPASVPRDTHLTVLYATRWH